MYSKKGKNCSVNLEISSYSSEDHRNLISFE